MKEMRMHVNALDGYLTEFLNYHSLKKIGKLEDFTYNLKILVDKTGIVCNGVRTPFFFLSKRMYKEFHNWAK